MTDNIDRLFELVLPIISDQQSLASSILAEFNDAYMLDSHFQESPNNQTVTGKGKSDPIKLHSDISAGI